MKSYTLITTLLLSVACGSGGGGGQEPMDTPEEVTPVEVEVINDDTPEPVKNEIVIDTGAVVPASNIISPVVLDDPFIIEDDELLGKSFTGFDDDTYTLDITNYGSWTITHREVLTNGSITYTYGDNLWATPVYTATNVQYVSGDNLTFMIEYWDRDVEATGNLMVRFSK